ncbi:hypothetical protein DVR12_07920 [Chitinophaga silvatica]|uniref:Uncharacterized protein n=1 Tax=Chitinophaga silvatica TaxID=2282649 RepID=A0A3E1YEY3_9BACT|nr:hypothetical protein [Chitinophaga silvatica]RFS25102.1 hypothetical protein DVR12_07920 [Chitinophaga silvatica]
MEHISINPILNGKMYYLLFSVEIIGSLTIYTLVIDSQSILLSDILPTEVNIFSIIWGTYFNQKILWGVDGRIHTDEALEVCHVCYQELYKASLLKEKPKPQRGWLNKGK